MPKAVLDSGLTLHYQQIGRGPDLVMIHGLTGNLALWHFAIVPELMDEFRMLTYDLRGHGYSAMPESGYTPDDMARDLAGLLDALEIEQPFMVGHSFGADVGLYFNFHFPSRVRHFVAIEPVVPALGYLRAGDDWQGWKNWVAVLEQAGHSVPSEHRSDYDYLARMSVSIPKRWGPLNGRPLNAKPLLRLFEGTTMAADAETAGELTLDRIPAVSVPTTLVYSATSPFMGTHDYLLDHLPHARSVIIPTTDWKHFAPLEQPAAIIAELRASFHQSGEPQPPS